MKTRLTICALAFSISVPLAVGCDMGTYEERLEDRIDDMHEGNLPENPSSVFEEDSDSEEDMEGQ